jgi:hypothetical protein
VSDLLNWICLVTMLIVILSGWGIAYFFSALKADYRTGRVIFPDGSTGEDLEETPIKEKN